MHSRLAGLGVTLLLVACGRGAPETPAESGDDRAPIADGNFSARSYERNFVFASLDGDSIFLVPWLLETVATPDTVTREAGGWLARGGIWEAFYSEQSPEFQIYPNPATEILNIATDYSNSRLLYFNISDLSGKIVKRGEWLVKSLPRRVGIVDIDPAVYIIRLSDGRSSWSHTFVKK